MTRRMNSFSSALLGAGLALGLLCWLPASPAAAQNATVVSACGTPPAT